MSEETKVSVSGEEVIETNSDYLDAINDLKQNTVSKEAYAKLKEDNKRLLDALVNGDQIEAETETTVDVDELRSRLFGGKEELNNLEFVSHALKLRQACIDKGERSPFLPVGDHVTITSDMLAKEQRVADVLQDCVDFADGDSGVFTAQLQRCIKDTPLRRGR